MEDEDLVLEGFDDVPQDTPEAKDENQELLDKQNPDGSTEAEETKADEPQATEEETPVDDSHANEPEHKKSGAQKRIDKLVRQREDARREKEKLARELEEYKSKQAETTASDKPSRDDFEYEEDYQDALDSYRESDRSKKAETPSDNDTTDTQYSDNDLTNIEIIKEKLAYADKPDDFDSVALSDKVPLTPDIFEALANQADPAKVLYELGSNLERANEIANMSRAEQIIAIHELGKTAKVAPKPVTASKASAPISPVKGDRVESKSFDDMSYEEYEQQRNSNARRKRSDW